MDFKKVKALDACIGVFEYFEICKKTIKEAHHIIKLTENSYLIFQTPKVQLAE